MIHPGQTKGSVDRRRFLATGMRSALGLSFVPAAFRAADLRGADQPAVKSPVNPKPARHVIYLYMSGGMTHLDTFDPKPDLDASMRGNVASLATSADGIRVSEFLPRMAKQMHHATVVNSLTSTAGAHAQGNYLMHTSYNLRGTIVHPALGAWMQVLKPADPKQPKSDLPRNVLVNGGSAHPGAGFFDARYGPLLIGDPRRGLADATHRGSMDDLSYQLDLSAKLSADFRQTYKHREVQAYRDMYADAVALMKSEDLEVFDLDQENAKTRQRYGSGFGDGCLLARRLVERDVPFVEVHLGGWDTHDKNFLKVPERANQLDQGLASLLEDLYERGLLDETLVVLATEFGRTPRINANDGRDHHPASFTCLLAGGGVKGGFRYGRTDESASNVIESPMEIADFNATVAYAAGLPVRQIVYSSSMRPFSVAHKGKPVTELFA